MTTSRGALLTERSVYVSIDGVPTPSHNADAVVAGGGTAGAWCAYFLREAGLNQVIVLENETIRKVYVLF